MYRIIQHKSVIFSECVPNVCLVLNSLVFSMSDCSKCFTLHTLGYLFIPTHIWLLLEAFSHASITMRRRHSPDSCFLPHSVSWYVVCRLYFVGALLYNCMTSVIIWFNLRCVICPWTTMYPVYNIKRLWQRTYSHFKFMRLSSSGQTVQNNWIHRPKIWFVWCHRYSPTRWWRWSVKSCMVRIQ